MMAFLSICIFICIVGVSTAFSPLRFKNSLKAQLSIAILGNVLGNPLQTVASEKYPIQGPASIMASKAHGTSEIPAQNDLLYHVDVNLADKISNYNRNWAEFAGYWRTTSFLTDVDKSKVTTFYDSDTGKPLFRAPVGRSFDDFVAESTIHGWPSFRDEEVVWDNVRALKDG